MADIEELYQTIILDHNSRPRNYGVMTEPTHRAMGRNPICGDELEIQLQVTNGVIENIQFTGQGCAISKASASMMTEAVSGKPVAQAQQECADFLGALSPDGTPALAEDSELAALLGVKKFPARLKCATLAWHALNCALTGGESVSTEDQ